MSQGFDLLETKLGEVRGVVDSTVALIDALIAKIGNATSMEEVQTILTELDVEKERLGEKVAQNP